MQWLLWILLLQNHNVCLNSQRRVPSYCLFSGPLYFYFLISLAPDFSFLFFLSIQVIAPQSIHCFSEVKQKENILPKIAISLLTFMLLSSNYFSIELSQESQGIERKPTAQMMENLLHMYSQAAKWDFWHFIQTCLGLVFVSSSYCFPLTPILVTCHQSCHWLLCAALLRFYLFKKSVLHLLFLTLGPSHCFYHLKFLSSSYCQPPSKLHCFCINFCLVLYECQELWRLWVFTLLTS